MAYFLQRDDGRPPVGGQSMVGRPPAMDNFGGPPSPQQQGGPSSPLSRFVQQGYVPAGAPQGQRGGGFDAGIAQQWTNNVQQTTAAHQQQNDPNFVEKRAKPTGYRVSNAPGGASSLSLAWDETPGGGGAAPMQRGRAQGQQRPDNGMGGCLGGGAWANQPNDQMYQPNVAASRPNYQGPGAYASAACGRASSREEGGMAGCLGGAPQSQPGSRGSARAASPGMASRQGGGMAACMSSAAYDTRAPASYGGGGGGAPPSYGGAPYQGGGGGAGGAGFARPPPMQPVGGRCGGASQADNTSLAFGGRGDGGSSNAYASGGNQNVGNGITDRRTTRVLEPPGGRSQISFG